MKTLILKHTQAHCYCRRLSLRYKPTSVYFWNNKCIVVLKHQKKLGICFNTLLYKIIIDWKFNLYLINLHSNACSQNQFYVTHFGAVILHITSDSTVVIEENGIKQGGKYILIEKTLCTKNAHTLKFRRIDIFELFKAWQNNIMLQCVHCST